MSIRLIDDDFTDRSRMAAHGSFVRTRHQGSTIVKES
jgi:hypothetical protein